MLLCDVLCFLSVLFSVTSSITLYTVDWYLYSFSLLKYLVWFLPWLVLIDTEIDSRHEIRKSDSREWHLETGLVVLGFGPSDGLHANGKEDANNYAVQ